MKAKIFLFTLIFLMINSFIYGQNKTDAQGKKHGKWVGYYEPSKNIRYQGTFEHGVEKDTFYFYDNVKSKTINAIRIFSDNGKKVYTKFYHGKFLVSEGAEVDRKREGIWKYYHYNSNQIMTTEFYVNNEIDGVRSVFYQNGLLAEECFYKNGKKEGVYKKYATNKVVLEESFYVDNQLDGKIIIRDTDGKIIVKGTYKKDVSVGIWEYYENGKLVKKVDKDKKPEVVTKFK
ncbi:MAG: toxin-antitoxin system YwqK family antitoxin [Flavobacterium sp.]